MTNSVALYGHWICPYVLRVEFALAQRGVAYDLVDLPPSAVRPVGFVLPPEFVEHSPRLEVPMLRIGERYLADSIPILEWMETEFPDNPLLPDSAATRTLVRERVQWIDEFVFRAMIGIYYGTDPDRIARASSALERALGEVDGWLADADWLGGSAPTLVEAVMVPFYVRLDGLRALGFGRPLPPRVAGHAARCRGLAGWDAVAWSDEQTAEFVGRFTKYRERAAAR